VFPFYASNERLHVVDMPCHWVVGRFGRCGLWNDYSCSVAVLGSSACFEAVSGNVLTREKDWESVCCAVWLELDGGRRVTLWMSPQYSGIYGHVIPRTMEHIT